MENLKNINFMTQAQFASTSVKSDELYAVETKLSSQGMPSGTKVALTIPASGVNMKAPRDGYVQLAFKSSAANGYFTLLSSTYIYVTNIAASANQTLRAYMPMKQNITFRIDYTNGSIVSLDFIYAEGDK